LKNKQENQTTSTLRTDGQTDGQTGGRHTVASKGKVDHGTPERRWGAYLPVCEASRGKKYAR